MDSFFYVAIFDIMIKGEIDNYENEENNWNLSRKQFIQSLLLLGAASQIPLFTSCETKDAIPEINFDCSPLSKDQTKVLQHIQMILFPQEGNGPSALEVHADQYLIWVLNDSLLDKRENDYIIDRLDQFILLAKEEYNKDFLELTQLQKEDFIELVNQEDWGGRWLSRLMTLIFEAMLLDPIYGGNPDGIAWQWLNHDPGYPRPVNENAYPTIIAKVNEI